MVIRMRRCGETSKRRCVDVVVCAVDLPVDLLAGRPVQYCRFFPQARFVAAGSGMGEINRAGECRASLVACSAVAAVFVRVVNPPFSSSVVKWREQGMESGKTIRGRRELATQRRRRKELGGGEAEGDVSEARPAGQRLALQIGGLVSVGSAAQANTCPEQAVASQCLHSGGGPPSGCSTWQQSLWCDSDSSSNYERTEYVAADCGKERGDDGRTRQAGRQAGTPFRVVRPRTFRDTLRAVLAGRT